MRHNKTEGQNGAEDTSDPTFENSTDYKSEKTLETDIPNAEPGNIIPKKPENMEIHASHLHHAPGEKYRIIFLNS